MEHGGGRSRVPGLDHFAPHMKLNMVYIDHRSTMSEGKSLMALGPRCLRIRHPPLSVCHVVSPIRTYVIDLCVIRYDMALSIYASL